MDQYYYMHPCHGSDQTDLPVNIIGKHQKKSNRVSGLDYLVLELFDLDGTQFVVFLNPNIQKYAEALDNDPTNTIFDAETHQHRIDLTADETTRIGQRFEIVFEQQSEKEILVTLTIDDECAMDIYMKGQSMFSSTLNRYRMNYARINPPNCYKCMVFLCFLVHSMCI